MLKLDIPGGSDRVLLHSCCAPCSGAIIECLLENGVRPVIYFSNSNIDTREEFEKRLAEVRRYADKTGLEVVTDEYDHADWLAAVRGLEGEPERGGRCLQCFKYRLKRAAEFASEGGFEVLTTSLASSRWKSLEQVAAAGEAVCPDIFWNQNWRKGGLQERRAQVVKEENFYNQTYCGCEFCSKK